MFIREYQSSDCKESAELFYNTVHKVNAKDYTKEQLDAWAAARMDLEKWDRSLREHFSLVAVADGIIVGFGDADGKGFLDRLFVHADYQGQGIGTALCDRLESAIQGDIVTHSSLTARPFFESRGYMITDKQLVERHGILLANYVMSKKRRVSPD